MKEHDQHIAQECRGNKCMCVCVCVYLRACLCLCMFICVHVFTIENVCEFQPPSTHPNVFVRRAEILTSGKLLASPPPSPCSNTPLSHMRLTKYFPVLKLPPHLPSCCTCPAQKQRSSPPPFSSFCNLNSCLPLYPISTLSVRPYE